MDDAVVELTAGSWQNGWFLEESPQFSDMPSRVPSWNNLHKQNLTRTKDKTKDLISPKIKITYEETFLLYQIYMWPHTLTHTYYHLWFLHLFHTAQRKIGLRQFNAEYSAISKNVVAMSFQYKMWAIYDHIYILFTLQVWKKESKINISCNAYSSKSSSRGEKKKQAPKTETIKNQAKPNPEHILQLHVICKVVLCLVDVIESLPYIQLLAKQAIHYRFVHTPTHFNVTNKW